MSIFAIAKNIIYHQYDITKLERIKLVINVENAVLYSNLKIVFNFEINHA
ncbi:hypothetical protein GASC598I20_000230 [Gilliamella apicola SCGC AB-598-I20]|nr:hypothetical protein GASC598I20_000160 [Gilliamella apicola SCGC AB-598-I20]KES14116.1 hypothetical protein GASC598I20_000230 [Gilliamella apicola SCGC AB-598-I20]